MSFKKNDDMTVPKDSEELIYVQKRIQDEVFDALSTYKEKKQQENLSLELCDIYDGDWILGEKISMLDKLTEIERPPALLPSTNAEKNLFALNMLNELSEKLCNAREILEVQVKTLQKQIQDDEEILSVLKDNTKSLIQEDSEVNTLKLADVRSRKEFQVSRKYMHQVLQLSGSSTLIDLVKDLTVAYFEGGEDKYLDKSKYVFTDIVLLKDASLVTQHPNDKNKIKFRELF